MPGAIDLVLLFFCFALGASVGSFLNVVVLRLPDAPVPDGLPLWKQAAFIIKTLSHPASHCPKCGYVLRWYDNFPVFGWLWLGGKCRKCKLPISVRYPLTEAFTGLLFAGLYALFFMTAPTWGPPVAPQAMQFEVSVGRLPPELIYNLADEQETSDTLRTLIPEALIDPDASVEHVELVDIVGNRAVLEARWRSEPVLRLHWPILAMVFALAWCLLAASLIDAAHFYIPRWLSYGPAVVGLIVHPLVDQPGSPISLLVGPVGCGWAIGGAAGWILGLLLIRFGLLQRSFRDGMPLLESERDAAGEAEPTPEEWRAIKRLTRREMGWELAFLMLPIGLGLLGALWASAGGALWESLAQNRAASAFCGSLLGGLVGGGVIWIVRVLGSLGFGREAMGLGDADLMFGVGCCLGAGIAGVALFPAAMVGLVFAVIRLVVRSRHEMPFGPYLAIASVAMLVLGNPFYDWASPSFAGLRLLLGRLSPLVGL